MPRKKISITTLDGSTRELDAEVKGDWAVHAFYKKDGTLDSRTPTITYIPTGRVLGWADKKSNALAFVRAINNSSINAAKAAEGWQPGQARDDNPDAARLADLARVHHVHIPLPS